MRFFQTAVMWKVRPGNRRLMAEFWMIGPLGLGPGSVGANERLGRAALEAEGPVRAEAV